jgi:hypothetical protein
VKAIKKPPRLFLSLQDSQNLRCLFLGAYQRARSSGLFCSVEQGRLWRLRSVLSVAQLEQLARLSEAAPHWNQGLKKLHARLNEEQGAGFKAALLYALHFTPMFLPEEIIKVLLAVAQSLRAEAQMQVEPDEPAFRNCTEQYEHIAKSTPGPLPLPTSPVAQPPPAAFTTSAVISAQSFDLSPYEERRDEQGDCLDIPRLTLWHASHRGPEHAQKLENQDATFVLPCGGGAVFAVADGVSTSTGARLAASVAVRSFCEHLYQQWTANTAPSTLLQEAAAASQRQLENLLEDFAAQVATERFRSLCGDLPLTTVQRLIENTLQPRKANWPTVLSTTLIGGVIVPHPSQRMAQVYLLRLGDGIVEHRQPSGWSVCLGMNRDETQISSFLAPGPKGKACLQNLDITAPITLQPGDELLISSDGLMRGHYEPVWQQVVKGELPARDDLALLLLQQAADRADQLSLSKNLELYGDNLSLILLRFKG